ncbi:hypothetical protein V8F33_004569 [Rhypophila sp. PSN 637]
MQTSRELEEQLESYNPRTARFQTPKKITNAYGATVADPTKRSLGTLPYELQTRIFQAASGPQFFFLNVQNGTLAILSRPAQKGISLACRLAREVYTKDKAFFVIGNKYYWVDSDNDIFYFQDTARPLDYMRWLRRRPHPVPVIADEILENINREFMHNVAFDFDDFGYPNSEMWLERYVCPLFPNIKEMHVLIPKGHREMPDPKWTPETLVIQDMPKMEVLRSPTTGVREMWYMIEYHLKKHMNARGRWAIDEVPVIIPHWASVQEVVKDD